MRRRDRGEAQRGLPGARAPRALAAALALALGLATGPALGQQPQPSGSAPQQQPPPDRGDVSVPRGADGAIFTPPDQQPAPDGSKARLPRPLNYTPPRYPAEAEKKGLEATVTLQLDIDRSGKVTKAFVVDPAGNGFDEAAVEAAQKLEFDPARKADGTPTPARILYRYSWTMKKGPEGPAQPGDAPAVTEEPFSGTILVSPSDAPIAGATITLRAPDSTEQTVTADAEGRFRVKSLKAGVYRVTVRSAGFDPIEVEERIEPGEPLEVKYRLVVAASGLEVVVRGPRPPREVVKRTLQQREISRIPGTNGDALRSIQNLPGVARPPGIIGLLIVRGSGPQDTQAFVDGTLVPLIYHFGGLSSVIPTEMIEKIDFYPGNFSAQYGRVMGGIVDAGIRSPKTDGKYHGLVQFDLIDGRALFEGPIPLLDGWNFVVAGRRSYLDAWLGPALEEAGAGVTQAPVYYDYQALVETNPTPASKFRVAFFGSDDALELLLSDPQPQEPALSGNVGLHTAFQRLQVRYENDFEGDDRLAGVFSLNHDIAEFGLGPFFFLLDLFSLGGRLEYSRTFSKEVTLNVGADVFAGLAEVNLRLPAPPRPGAPPNQPFSTRNVNEISVENASFFPAGYVELEIAPDARAKIVPGLRVDYYSITDRVEVSPRLNARYAIMPSYPRTTAKGGVGVFNQPPQFQEAIPPIGTPGLQAARATHYALGLEQDFTRNIEASVEGFYKQLDDLIIGTPTLSGSLEYDNVGRGYVVGSEFLLKYKPDDRFFGWAAYTLSRSTRIDGPGKEERLVPFDQTHILTLLGSYQLGHGWEFGARFRLVSGNLTTPFVCDSLNASCDLNRTNALFHAASGAYTPIPLTGPATERLPLYHQLDLRVDKRWKFKRWQLSAYLDVQNVYNSANAEAISYNFNYTGRQYVTGIPILPSIGLRGDF